MTAQFTTWYSHVTDKFHAVSRFPARYATGRGNTPEQALAAAKEESLRQSPN